VTLKYIYLPEMGVTDLEAGALLWMDANPAVSFAKDYKGGWNLDSSLRDEDGNFDLSWSTRTINSLIKKGWVVEEGTYDHAGRPLKVQRSGKEGYPV
jgi:hypothetical protein